MYSLITKYSYLCIFCNVMYILVIDIIYINWIESFVYSTMKWNHLLTILLPLSKYINYLLSHYLSQIVIDVFWTGMLCYLGQVADWFRDGAEAVGGSGGSAHPGLDDAHQHLHTGQTSTLSCHSCHSCFCRIFPEATGLGSTTASGEACSSFLIICHPYTVQ